MEVTTIFYKIYRFTSGTKVPYTQSVPLSLCCLYQWCIHSRCNFWKSSNKYSTPFHIPFFNIEHGTSGKNNTHVTQVRQSAPLEFPDHVNDSWLESRTLFVTGMATGSGEDFLSQYVLHTVSLYLLEPLSPTERGP